MEELYKKDLHDPDNHDDVITNLEPDILECEVKWALESIPTNKASGEDGIPVELFQILKYDAVKVLHSICQQLWKTQQWPQDWKRSVFTPIPKKGNAEECSNYHTIPLISQASITISEFSIGETKKTVRDFIVLGPKITADGDFSHEIKRCFESAALNTLANLENSAVAMGLEKVSFHSNL